MAAEKPNDKVEKLSEVKIEKTQSKSDKDTTVKEEVNLINAVSDQFGLATFDVRDMILSGTVKIEGSEWRPKDGDFNIPADDIHGKEIEIISSPKSVKFTLDVAELNEYRTSASE